MRNELIRDNSYWRTYEAIRLAVNAARRHREPEAQVARVEPKSLGRVSRFVALR